MKAAKYEVMVLFSKEDYVNKKLLTLQNDGWQIAGFITITNRTGHTNDNFLSIPLKRVIKNDNSNNAAK